MKKHTKQMVSQTSTNLMMDLIARIDQKYWKLYGYLMAVGILCHGFMLFNKIPNHDDVAAIFTKGTTYPLGRWFLNFTSVIAGGFSIPLFIGLFSLTMIIGSAFLVCKVLDIEDTGRIFAVGAVMVCFPAVAGTFAFMFTADSYFLALFLACAGVWFTVKLPIKMKKRGGGKLRSCGYSACAYFRIVSGIFFGCSDFIGRLWNAVIFEGIFGTIYQTVFNYYTCSGFRDASLFGHQSFRADCC